MPDQAATGLVQQPEAGPIGHQEQPLPPHTKRCTTLSATQFRPGNLQAAIPAHERASTVGVARAMIPSDLEEQSP